MPRRPESLTPAEWKVMKIVWRLERCAARDVYEAAGSAHGMSVSTVKTHLRRLVEKGHLETTRVGNSFLYEPTTSALRSLCDAADKLLDNALDGTTAPLLAYMVKKSKLSVDEVDELRTLLDQAADEEDEA
ncbi:MAG: BlaI/MecI/CopY family transcriptional regulator [Planctomycetes bacterium]|nr:BlaI/MecI/CopY family transcriptional regulator [Planctomycetota bacterium]